MKRWLLASAFSLATVGSGVSLGVALSDSLARPAVVVRDAVRLEIKQSIIAPSPTATASSVSLLFVGDIMLDRHVASRAQTANDPAYPFRKLSVGWFDSYDYAIVNLEGPVTDKRRPPEKEIDFLFATSTGELLKAQGIDAVSQANNHALDQGSVGFDDSRHRLTLANLRVFGHQVKDDDIALATTTVRGLRIALLGFNTTDNPLDRSAASRVIVSAKQSADVVVAVMHWGSEYRHTPDSAVVKTAQWLIDQGVDAIIGGHPHWVQGFSSYKGHPIAYSLGNFIFDQDFSRETKQGMAVALEIFPQMNGARRLVLHPMPIDIAASQPAIVEGAARQTRLNEIANYSDEKLKQNVRQGELIYYIK